MLYERWRKSNGDASSERSSAKHLKTRGRGARERRRSGDKRCARERKLTPTRRLQSSGGGTLWSWSARESSSRARACVRTNVFELAIRGRRLRCIDLELKNAKRMLLGVSSRRLHRVKGSPKPLCRRSTTLEFCGCVGNTHVRLCTRACRGTLGAGGDLGPLRRRGRVVWCGFFGVIVDPGETRTFTSSRAPCL